MRYLLLVLFLITTVCTVQIFSGGDQELRVCDDPFTPLQVRVGERFIIRLESNRTTGYQWQLVQEPYTSIVKVDTVIYKTKASGLTGAGGEELWYLTPLEPGETTLIFQYCRVWEKDVPPAKYVQFRVIVYRQLFRL